MATHNLREIPCQDDHSSRQPPQRAPFLVSPMLQKLRQENNPPQEYFPPYDQPQKQSPTSAPQTREMQSSAAAVPNHQQREQQNTSQQLKVICRHNRSYLVIPPSTKQQLIPLANNLPDNSQQQRELSSCVVVGDLYSPYTQQEWIRCARQHDIKISSHIPASSLLDLLNISQRKDRKVDLVVLCLSGGNLCFERNISQEQWRRVIRELKKAYPKARLVISSIVYPFYGGLLKKFIKISNRRLKTAIYEARRKGYDVRGVDVARLTRKSDGRLRKELYSSSTSLTMVGLSKLITMLFLQK